MSSSRSYRTTFPISSSFASSDSLNSSSSATVPSHSRREEFPDTGLSLRSGGGAPAPSHLVYNGAIGADYNTEAGGSTTWQRSTGWDGSMSHVFHTAEFNSTSADMQRSASQRQPVIYSSHLTADQQQWIAGTAHVPTPMAMPAFQAKHEGSEHFVSQWCPISSAGVTQPVSTSPAPMMRGVFHTTLSRGGDTYHNIPPMGDLLSPEMSSAAATTSSYYDASPYVSPYVSPHQSPRARVADVDLPLLPTRETFRCLWGQGCGIPLDDISPGGLWRHFRDIHMMHDKHARVFCSWNGGCGQEMNCASLGNHISTVHLKTAAQVCSGCDARFTRGDALARHLKNNSCPASLRR